MLLIVWTDWSSMEILEMMQTPTFSSSVQSFQHANQSRIHCVNSHAHDDKRQVKDGYFTDV